MSGAYSGSGNASRAGHPIVCRPGSHARNVSLTLTQTCDGPTCSVAVKSVTTPSGERCPKPSPGLVAVNRTPVPSITDRPVIHRIADDAEVVHTGFEHIGAILRRLRG